MTQANNETLDQISDLVKFASKNKLSEFEYESKEFAVKVKKHENLPPAMPVEIPVPVLNSDDFDDDKVVKTPLAGVFYRANNSTSAPIAKEGDFIAPGTAIGLVSACKNMSEIISDKSGRIVKFLVNNEDSISKNQPILLLE